jgi:enoyl-CoA hydratase
MGNTLFIENQGHICTLYLNRPQRNNSLNIELFNRLYDALDSANKNENIRVIILRGAGESVFSTGIDLEEEVFKGRNPESLRDSTHAFKNAIEKTNQLILSCRCPVIAMIYGDCLASALDLVVSCDLRVASDISRFALFTVRLGHVFQYQGIQRLVNLIGPGYAKEILLTGRIIEAQKAKEMGLVNFMVPIKDVFSTTMSLANDIVDKAPLAVSGTKQVIHRLYKYQQQPGFDDKAVFQDIFDACVHSEDAKEGPRARLEGRKPQFIGK